MSSIRLEHVGIGARTDKYEETISFYERAFGWHRIKASTEGLIFTFVGDGAGGRIEILANDAPPLTRPHHLAFVVDKADLDATVEALRAAGAQVQEPTTNPFGDVLVFFTDPAGNLAQIVARPEPLAP